MKKLRVLVYDKIDPSILNILNTMYQVEIIKLGSDDIGARNTADLVLFHNEESGDMNPDYYSETVGSHTRIVTPTWKKYDALFHVSSRNDISKVGIGNGAQFLTVRAGGALIQHVENHTRPHDIETVSGFKGEAPSDHHQMMYPFEIPEDKYELLAWSTYFNSSTYLNGRNEEIVLAKDFLEPEIVLYNNVRGGALAIQGDPAKGTHDYVQLCKGFVSRIIKYKR